MIKLKSIEFHDNGIRKLRNLRIDFAERITLIAGYNGIGKSTILGLIAAASGTPKELESEERTYFMSKSFSTEINEIIHFDPKERDENKLASPWPTIIYSTNETELWKNIRITRRPGRLRSVSSTHIDSPNKDIAKPDGKAPLRTIYLGMLRMLPIGENSEKNIMSTLMDMAEEDAVVLKDFINSVIEKQILIESKDTNIQSVIGTKKTSIHPKYEYTSKSVSLGQDSLSSIATAIASFNKLKREQGSDYQGGLLVIDEIDAGFHPHAQQKLISALKKYARKLSLQIVATTHSSSLIEFTHSDSTINDNSHTTIDNVIYLADSGTPRIAAGWSLQKILTDMAMLPLPKTNNQKPEIPLIKVYLEDQEACDFLKVVLDMKKDFKMFYGNNRKKKVHLISLGSGGSNLLNMPLKDNYFKTVLIVVDDDTSIPRTITNALKLPSHIPGLNPEKTLFAYLKELAKGANSEYQETYNDLFDEGILPERIHTEFSLNKDITKQKRERQKQWFRDYYNKFNEYKIMKYWVKDNKTILEKFVKQFEEKIDNLIPK